LILGIWGVYLFPSFFGKRRNAPLNSTEEFDRWTHVMADVQRRSYTARRSNARDVIRARRRRALAGLIVVAAAALVVSFTTGNVWWLVAHLVVDALIAAYVGLLLHVKQQQAVRVAHHHLMERPANADEPQVRIVAGS
jgi:Flp pilus assembly protein TadB